MGSLIRRLSALFGGGELSAADFTSEEHFDTAEKLARWHKVVRREQADIRRRSPLRLEADSFKVFSQGDEDGVIDGIFSRIGATNRTFVEFGAEVGLQNNTRFLLANGWNGLWIEGNPDYQINLREAFKDELASVRLKFLSAYVNRDNINDLIAQSGISGEIDLLSIDIDSNDYHVWKAIDVISPRLVVAEHNDYAPPRDWVMPYDPNFRWNGNTQEFGSSLVANVRLAAEKGYTLVSTGMYTPNGFYVRSDLIGDKFVGPFDAASSWHPSSYLRAVNFPALPETTVSSSRGWDSAAESPKVDR